MGSTFGGIYQASAALNAARYGLEVTGQNIANANTPGYTRQTARQAAIGGAVGVTAIHTGYIEEGGVRIVSTDRLADPVLNARSRTEHGRSAAANVTTGRLADLEDIFNEPTNNGLSARLNDYWNAWGDVANDPGAQVPREMLINAATSVTVTLHSMDSALDDVAKTAYDSLDARITEANTAATELADLNTKIVTGKASKVNVNNLLDRRDMLLDTLSTTVGAKATIEPNGSVSVTVGGGTGNPDIALVTAVTTSSPSEAFDLQLDATSYDVSINSTSVQVGGAAKAEHTALTDDATGIPAYRDQLNKVAQKLAKSVNDLQGDGYDLVKIDGTKGSAMFAGLVSPSSESTNVNDISAANIKLADGFAWQSVAASSVAPAPPPSAPLDPPIVNLGGSNALGAAGMGADGNSPDIEYSSLIGSLGLASASAQQLQATQSSITASVDVLQQQSSGVSFDEEVANMLTYQTAYQASARVLTTMDSMLDTLINRTGLVGR